MSRHLSPNPDDRLGPTRELLKKYGLKPKDSLGQNFLIDLRPLPKIMAAAEIGPADSVLEIGPGLGVLTRPLAEKARQVLAVEKDEGLSRLLKRELGDLSNVSVLNQDIRCFLEEEFDWSRYKVVANLPFYLTSPLIMGLLEQPDPLALIVVMVQKEVAERICAVSPRRSRLGVLCQLRGACRIVCSVPAESFWPRPKVDAAVIKIEPEGKPIESSLRKLIDIGFSHPRKTLANNLAGKIKNSSELIECGKLPAKIRAEKLSLEDWRRLHRCFIKSKSEL